MRKGLFLGFSILLLACAGMGQTREAAVEQLCGGAASCTACPEPLEDGFEDALFAHVSTIVSNEEVLAHVEKMRGLSDAERMEELAVLARSASTSCPLREAFVARDKHWRATEVARLCALGSTCEGFDPTDPRTLVPCAEAQLDPVFASELSRMNLASPVGLANALDGFTRKHTTAGCALTTVLRSAQ